MIDLQLNPEIEAEFMRQIKEGDTEGMSATVQHPDFCRVMLATALNDPTLAGSVKLMSEAEFEDFMLEMTTGTDNPAETILMQAFVKVLRQIRLKVMESAGHA